MMQLYFLNKAVNIGVVIPAKNEEKYLGKTLKALKNQFFRPSCFVVVNDGSTDKTEQIARAHGAYVVNRPQRNLNVLGRPEECENWNLGIRELQRHIDLDYVMILGADQVLYPDYIEKVIKVFHKDNEVVIASGVVKGETSKIPRGSGRIYDYDFFNMIDFFPLNYGGETYPIAWAYIMKLKTKIVYDAYSVGQRKTGYSFKKSFYTGKGRRALRYDPFVVLRDSLKLLGKNPFLSISFLCGYVSKTDKYYEVDLGKLQRQRLRRKLKDAFRFGMWKKT